MDCAIVLNACSRSFKDRVEEMNGFLSSGIEGLSEAGGKTTAIIFHDGAMDAQEPADIPRLPVESLFFVKMDSYNPETALAELCGIASRLDAGLYLFPGDYSGSELSVRFAGRSGGSVLTQVSRMEFSGESLRCDRPVYSNHLKGSFEMRRRPWCISIGHGSAEPRSLGEHIPVAPEKIFRIDAAGKGPGFIKSARFFREEKQDRLEHADFVIAGGRGVGGKDSCERLKVRAELLGAEFGVSRLAAMNGWASMDRMIGVSGSITKPDLCIVAGASGAAAFMAGIEKSGFILSVNTDPRAPVFRQSDVGVLEDYDAFMEALAMIVEEEKSRDGR